MNEINSTTATAAATDRDAISVLLVDDQRFIGMAVTRLLGNEPDIKLHCCYSAADAVAQANQVTPHVILQDLQMPDIDGLTLVGLYRSNPQTAKTRIVVLSGNDDAASRAAAKDAGADDYLVKLPTKAVLLECVRLGASRSELPSSRTSELPREADVTLDSSIIAGIRESFSSGGPDLVSKLIDQFVKEASLLVDRLTRAAATGDSDALKAAGHSLKGTSMTIGAQRLATLAGTIERQAMSDPTGPVDRGLTTAIVEELDRVRAACAKEKHAVVGSGRS